MTRRFYERRIKVVCCRRCGKPWYEKSPAMTTFYGHCGECGCSKLHWRWTTGAVYWLKIRLEWFDTRPTKPPTQGKGGKP